MPYGADEMPERIFHPCRAQEESLRSYLLWGQWSATVSKQTGEGERNMKRYLILVFALTAYGFFLATFVYLPAFLADVGVPKTVNSGEESAWPQAMVVNVALLALFAVQHSVMARPWFKAWWTQWVPKAMERSVFVVAASAVLVFLYWQWQPIRMVVWEVDHPVGRGVLWTLFLGGYAMALYSSFLIDHFELFGVRQAWFHATGRTAPEPEFMVRSLYRHVRHPLMAGLLLMFWSTPTMTVGHLFFTGVLTSYILVGIAFEERDLVRFLGAEYQRYRGRTPMLVPLPRRRRRLADEQAETPIACLPERQQ